MRYVVFEAGSRAGFSTELFFSEYQEQTKNDDTLVMVDADETFSLLECRPKITRMSEKRVVDGFFGKGDVIFPADELTRQHNPIVREFASNNRFSAIGEWFYDKAAVNCRLHSTTCISVPEVFRTNRVFIRPNTMSAGSKGCYMANNVCVSEYIPIRHEYVVDCLERDGDLSVFAREVVLKNGYDKYVCLIPMQSPFCEKVKDFVLSNDIGLFKGIFHLQLAEGENGRLYYIESSKRISGTSCVNMVRGFNPFFFMNGIEHKVRATHLESKWMRYESLLTYKM